MLLGLAVASVFTLSLSEESLLTWGWRIPFISGMLIGMVGLYIRIRLAESPLYLEAKISGYLSSCPLREALWDWRKILLGIGLYINVTAQFYAATVFIPSYMTTVGYLPHQSSIACSIILITMMIFFPIAANISDKIGRKPVMIASCIGIVMTVCPVFFAINSMNYQTAIFSEIIFAIIVAKHMGPVPTILSELIPTRVRFTSVALSSNLSAAIFGGTVPMIGAALYQFTGKFSVAYYLTSLAVFGFFIILRYRETLGQVLSDIKKETACPDLKIETGRREEKRILEPS